MRMPASGDSIVGVLAQGFRKDKLMYGLSTGALILFTISFPIINGFGSLPHARAQESVPSVTIPRGLTHAAEFVEFLRKANLRVEKVQQSHFSGFLGSEKMAAFIATDKGSVEVVFLEGDAREITFTYKKGSASNEQHIYVVNGEALTGKSESINAAYPIYITLHKNWFIVTLDCELESAIKRALGQTNRLK